jgi:transcriptional regulatory protein LEU3
VLTLVNRITSYLRLVVLATPFERLPPSELTRNSSLVTQAIQSAREVIRIMVENLRPTGFLRFAMEANFVYVSFAAAFLINVCHFALVF